MRSIARVQTTDRNINQLQNNILTGLQPILQNPALDYNLLKSVALTTGSNSFAHGLGRTLQGWLIVRQKAQADIWDTQDSNSNPQNTLFLNSSANVEVDVYVF